MCQNDINHQNDIPTYYGSLFLYCHKVQLMYMFGAYFVYLVKWSKYHSYYTSRIIIVAKRKKHLLFL